MRLYLQGRSHSPWKYIPVGWILLAVLVIDLWLSPQIVTAQSSERITKLKKNLTENIKILKEYSTKLEQQWIPRLKAVIKKVPPGEDINELDRRVAYVDKSSIPIPDKDVFDKDVNEMKVWIDKIKTFKRDMFTSQNNAASLESYSELILKELDRNPSKALELDEIFGDIRNLDIIEDNFYNSAVSFIQNEYTDVSKRVYTVLNSKDFQGWNSVDEELQNVKEKAQDYISFANELNNFVYAQDRVKYIEGNLTGIDKKLLSLMKDTFALSEKAKSGGASTIAAEAENLQAQLQSALISHSAMNTATSLIKSNVNQFSDEIFKVNNKTKAIQNILDEIGAGAGTESQIRELKSILGSEDTIRETETFPSRYNGLSSDTAYLDNKWQAKKENWNKLYRDVLKLVLKIYDKKIPLLEMDIPEGFGKTVADSYSLVKNTQDLYQRLEEKKNKRTEVKKLKESYNDLQNQNQFLNQRLSEMRSPNSTDKSYNLFDGKLDEYSKTASNFLNISKQLDDPSQQLQNEVAQIEKLQNTIKSPDLTKLTDLYYKNLSSIILAETGGLTNTSYLQQLMKRFDELNAKVFKEYVGLEQETKNTVSSLSSTDGKIETLEEKLNRMKTLMGYMYQLLDKLSPLNLNSDFLGNQDPDLKTPVGPGGNNLPIETRSSKKFYRNCNLHKRCLPGIGSGDVDESKNCTLSTMGICDIAIAYGGVYEDFFDDNFAIFEIIGKSDKWVAIGLSNDTEMGMDFVVECVLQGGVVDIFMSWNFINEEGHKDNSRISMPKYSYVLKKLESFIDRGRGEIYCRFGILKAFQFDAQNDLGTGNFGKRGQASGNKVFTMDLNRNYFNIIMAKGDKASQNNLGYHRKTYFTRGQARLAIKFAPPPYNHNYFHAHGHIMFINWLFIVPVSNFITRFYKETFVNIHFWGYPLWLTLHTVSMVLSVILTFAGSMVMSVGKAGWLNLNELTSEVHMWTGLFSGSLLVCGIYGATLMRYQYYGDPEDSEAFRRHHTIYGHVVFLLAFVPLYTSTDQMHSHLPCSVSDLLIIWLVCYIFIIIVMSYHYCWIEWIVGAPARPRPNVHLGPLEVMFQRMIGMEPGVEPPGGKIRRIILAIFVTICLVFTITACVLLSNASEENACLVPKTTKYNPVWEERRVFG